MATVDVSGTAGGNGFLLNADVSVVHYAPGAMSGTGMITGAEAILIIFSGFVQGSGGFLDPFQIPLSGTTGGTSSLTASDPTVIRNFHGAVYGHSFLGLYGVPEAMYGAGDITGYFEVDTLRPYCCTCGGNGTPIVGWQQNLGRNDLTLSITDLVCNPVTPYAIGYTLYQVRGQFLERVGCERTPVSPCVGSFYATGSLGDLGGQPGDWVITWQWQRSFGGAIEFISQRFRVQDAAMANDPNDTLVRVKKFGWFD